MLDLFLAGWNLWFIKYKQNRIGSNWLKYNKNSKNVCFLDLRLNFVIKRIIFGHKILKMELLDNFEQASKQKRMVGCFLEI